MIALIPGSFDPLTYGHLDVITRTAAFAQRVIVAVGVNFSKSTVSATQIRLDSVKAGVAHLPNVEVVGMAGLLADLYREVGADIVVKGVRDMADMDSEMTQASANRDIGDVETVWLPTRPELRHVSSSLVRELYGWGMDVSRYVPQEVLAIWGENRIS